MLKELRERYRGIVSYQQRETCIRRELRRARSPEIQLVIDRFNNMIKQASGTKRATDTVARQDNKKRVKMERREAAVVGL